MSNSFALEEDPGKGNYQALGSILAWGASTSWEAPELHSVQQKLHRALAGALGNPGDIIISHPAQGTNSLVTFH